MNSTLPALASALFVTAAAAQQAAADAKDEHAVFQNKRGEVIVWDARDGTLRLPHAPPVRLSDCSDEFQTCLTDHRGFAFATFRNCDDIDDSRLTFRPTVVSAIHNQVWMVFDAAPRYMFHFAGSRGIVGIYMGSSSSHDFRTLLRRRNFRLGEIDAMEYQLTGSGTFAACKSG